jgi:hypothetical protein
MRYLVLPLISLALALTLACRTKTADVPEDAMPNVLSGDVSADYASELDALCAFIPLGRLIEKPRPEREADPSEFLRLQSARAQAPRTRALIARVLATPARERGQLYRKTFLDEAKPLLPPTHNYAGAPTAPWGRDDRPRDWQCFLADRLDALGR